MDELPAESEMGPLDCTVGAHFVWSCTCDEMPLFLGDERLRLVLIVLSMCVVSVS